MNEDDYERGIDAHMGQRDAEHIVNLADRIEGRTNGHDMGGLDRELLEVVHDRGVLIAAIQDYAKTHDGNAPTSTEWSKADRNGYPSAFRVKRVFGSWADAVEAAGFPRPTRGGGQRAATAPKRRKAASVKAAGPTDGPSLSLLVADLAIYADEFDELAKKRAELVDRFERKLDEIRAHGV